MHRILFAAAALAIATVPALAECPSGQINMTSAGSPERCEADVTATTPAPDVVEDLGDAAGEVARDAGAAVKDAGEAVADTVTDAVDDLTK